MDQVGAVSSANDDELLPSRTLHAPVMTERAQLPCVDVDEALKFPSAVVLDIGTGYTKAGFSGRNLPSCVIPSKGCSVRGHWETPFKSGMVKDWDALEELVCYIYQRKLKVFPEDHAVLLSDPPLCPTATREKFAELMFETFNVPAMHAVSQPVLSAVSYGKTSALVVDCGHGASRVVPINDGKCIASETRQVGHAGETLNSYLESMLCISGTSTPNTNNFVLLDEIKKRYCYLAINTDSDLTEINCTTTHGLPDGTTLILGNERFMCPEVLFQPSIVGSREPGIPILIMNIINMCDVNLKSELLDNVLVCGGSTMFPGFQMRLQRELDALVGESVTVVAAPERDNAVWKGGSMLASTDSFQRLWIRKNDYEERGSSVFHGKDI
ncbi:actin-like protein 7B [Brachyhypopomus gauderio]|uniref:actin-like protein 7B n=1 Tax=Brachyhypopomus gauderio TaxID=698409 RepID=UPI004041DCFC